MLSYPGCHARATYTGCIGIHAHGRQVTSMLCLSDVIRYTCILTYSGTSRSVFKNKKKTVVSKKNNEGRIEKAL